MPTVTVPDNAYVTVADVTSALGAGWAFPSGWDTGAQQSAVIRAKQTIDNAIKTTFGQTAINVECDGTGHAYLGLQHFTHWPLLSITQVVYRDNPADDWDTANGLLDSGSYAMAHSRRGVERIHGDTVRTGGDGADRVIWIKGFRNYRIDGVFGAYEIPEGIKRAAILLVREEAEPGYTDKHDQAITERWPDGYQVDRSSPRVTPEFTQFTGHRAIDTLLLPFVSQPIGFFGIA